MTHTELKILIRESVRRCLLQEKDIAVQVDSSLYNDIMDIVTDLRKNSDIQGATNKMLESLAKLLVTYVSLNKMLDESISTISKDPNLEKGDNVIVQYIKTMKDETGKNITAIYNLCTSPCIKKAAERTSTPIKEADIEGMVNKIMQSNTISMLVKNDELYANQIRVEITKMLKEYNSENSKTSSVKASFGTRIYGDGLNEGILHDIWFKVKSIFNRFVSSLKKSRTTLNKLTDKLQ